MLSRRHIRIKVMQLLYAKSRDSDLTLDDLLRRFQTYGKKTLELYVFNLYQFIEVAHYAVKDYDLRKAKFIQIENDKKFSPSLYENDILQGFINGGRYKKALRSYSFIQFDPEKQRDTTRLIYQKFLETEVYKNYLELKTLTDDAHKEILLDLYRFLSREENFLETMEDFSMSWIDDDTLIEGAMKKTIKAMPSDELLIDSFSEEDKQTFEFGEKLLVQSYKRDEEVLEIIKPILQNWDSERVAAVDMILMKMAVCELLYFPSIPIKVTINEYVDVSKMYSTDKSKDFVNGILDKIMKQLKEENKIVKEGRGLVE